MEKHLLRSAHRFLDELKNMDAKRSARLCELEEYSDLQLKIATVKNGIPYYSFKKRGEKKFAYLGNQSNLTVRRIHEARFIRKSLDIIRKDIDLLETFLRNYESVEFQHVNSQLPKRYWNLRAESAIVRKKKAREWKDKMEKYKLQFPPYRPEELIHTTIDGTKVRSKSEALIYNMLFEAGYTFVYELPLKGKTRTFYPDFTILSEIDYKTVIRIEHQGKMGDDEYRQRSEAREYDYWNNGFLPNRDVYFTYDDCKGGFDITPIVEILCSRVRPS